MKHLLRAGLILSAALSLVAFLVSLYKAWNLYLFSPDAGSSLTYHFSLYLPDNRNSFFTGIIRGAEIAAAELNSEVSIHSIDPSKNELETAAYTGVDGVIVCPYLDDALARRQLEKLGEFQMPVVLINHNLPHDQPWPFIGTNNFDMGRRIGQVSLNQGESDVRIALVYSDKAPGIYAERELVEMGITAALGDRLSGSIRSYRTNLNPLDAEALLYRLFRSQPGTGAEAANEINTIVFTDTDDTIAAAQTLVDLNLVGQVNVIGFGSDPGVLESIRKGIVSCSVSINSERIGYQAVRSLTALRTTGYTSTLIDTGVSIITERDL
ncbi:MAG: substrate-binding domain-containing protein [Treponema sp.]|jgi:ribose transport system substrate-binding protein|nr:substrate-binding domain-containing protein [Treponema sp.]